jgi:hypothetical protein
MEADDILEKVLQTVSKSRRSFLRKLVFGTAFAVPSVASFSMSGLGVGEAFANCSNLSGNDNSQFDEDCP